MSSELTQQDHELIDEFIRQARALAPHQPDLHDIDHNRFVRGNLSHGDIEDYFFSDSEYLGGMASIILATIAAGIDAADQIGIDG